MLARGDPYITVGGSRKESSWQKIEAEDLHQTGRCAAAREPTVLQEREVPAAQERTAGRPPEAGSPAALQLPEAGSPDALQLPEAGEPAARQGTVRPHTIQREPFVREAEAPAAQRQEQPAVLLQAEAPSGAGDSSRISTRFFCLADLPCC